MFSRFRQRQFSTVLAAAVVIVSTILSAPSAFARGADKYVALGDSYSAGNGANSTNLDKDCNRNTFAYPYLAAQQRPNTELHFVACSGAKTDDVIKDQVKALDASTKLVSITIGGNDIGFSNLMLNCTLEWSPNCKSAVEESRNKIHNELPGKLDNAYKAIKSGAPNATQVAVLGYPRLVGDNLSCPAAGGINKEEAGWLNGLVDDLDKVVDDRASAAGFHYQSSISSFTGHDMCAAEPWVNGRALNIKDMYHPTRAGYQNGFLPEVRKVIG